MRFVKGLLRVLDWSVGIVSLLIVALLAHAFYLYGFGGLKAEQKLDTPDGLFVVGGWSVGPLNGWTYYLYWKRPHELWASTYLAHDDGRWRDLRMTYSGNVITINGVARSSFDCGFASWPIARQFTVVNDKLYEIRPGKPGPVELTGVSVFRNDPFGANGGGSEMDDGFKDWTNVYPMLKKDPKDIDWSYDPNWHPASWYLQVSGTSH
jgi:hypothetical protein